MTFYSTFDFELFEEELIPNTILKINARLTQLNECAVLRDALDMPCPVVDRYRIFGSGDDNIVAPYYFSGLMDFNRMPGRDVFSSDKVVASYEFSYFFGFTINQQNTPIETQLKWLKRWSSAALLIPSVGWEFKSFPSVSVLGVNQLIGAKMLTLENSSSLYGSFVEYGFEIKQ